MAWLRVLFVGFHTRSDFQHQYPHQFAANWYSAECLHHQSSGVRTTMLLNYDGMIEERKLLLMFYITCLTWNVDPLNRSLNLVCSPLML